MSDQIYTVTPRKARELIVDIVSAGLVPHLAGSPGIGKSAIAQATGNEFNLFNIDHRLSTSEPQDLTGVLRFNDDSAEFVPIKGLFPVEEDEIPEGKDGFCLILDEFMSMHRHMQAPSFKLILDRMVGQKRLHPRTIIITASNLATDRGIVNPMSTPLQSRLIHLELEVSFDEWLEDVAIPEKYDPRIISFLSQFPSKLMDFKPDHHEKTFCAPRTWSFLNRLIKGREVESSKAAMYAGTITSGVAMEFIQYCKVFANLINIKEVLADPFNAPVPNDLSLRWATITHLMELVTEDNFDLVSEYINRFDLSFRILFYRSLNINHKSWFQDHPAYAKATILISRHLYS